MNTRHWPRSKDQEISTRATEFPAIRPGRHSFPGLPASPGLYERNPCSRLSAFGEALFPLCINTVYHFAFFNLLLFVQFCSSFLIPFVSRPMSHSNMLPLWSMVQVHGAFAQRRLALAAVSAHATRARRTSRVTKGLPDKSNQRTTQFCDQS